MGPEGQAVGEGQEQELGLWEELRVEGEEQEEGLGEAAVEEEEEEGVVVPTRRNS